MKEILIEYTTDSTVFTKEDWDKMAKRTKMIKFTAQEIIDILQKEIEWCIDNPDVTLSNEFQESFVRGLVQAQYLIRKAEQRLIEEED